MRIKSLETANFGILPCERIEFGEGLTVVKGPNEAGKSFTIEAISQGLFGDGSTSAAHIQERCRRWGSDGPFFIRLEIEHGGENYTLTRDFENKKNILVRPDGTEVRDKRTIRHLIARMVGLPSLMAFAATACIQQEEVERIGDEISTLRAIIEGRIAGSGSDTDKLARKIDKAREEIRKKSGKKGQLVVLENRAAEVEKELDEKRGRLRELADNKKELVKVSEKLEGQKQVLRDKKNAFEGSRKYIESEKEYSASDKVFDSAHKNLEKYRKAIKDIQESSKALDAIKGKLDVLSDVISKAEVFNRADERCCELEKESKGLSKRIASIKEIEGQIKNKQKEIDALKIVDPVELKNAKNLPVEISGLKTSLSRQLFSVEVKPVIDTTYSITADGEMVEGPRAEVHADAMVDFPGVASVHFRNLTGDEEPIADEIKRKVGVLRAILDKYEVESVKALEQLHQQRTDALNEKVNLEYKKAVLLSDNDFSEIEASLRELNEELEKEEKARDDLKDHATTPEELKGKKVEKERLEADKKEKEALINKSKGILEAVGDDEAKLQEAIKAAAKELAVAEAHFKELAIYKCTPEEFEKLKREIENLNRYVKDLEEKQIVLTDRISQETVGEEDIAALEEQLEETKKRIDRLRHKYKVLGIIMENIAWAREQSIARFSEDIEKRMGEILSRITGGKYEKVKVDGNLSVSVYSPDKGDYIDVENNQDLLSSGALDQVYLAARFALLELIAGDSKPPIILDDTFVSFDDMSRKDRAFELLKSIADDYQVLYFTCHHCPEHLNVIEIK